MAHQSLRPVPVVVRGGLPVLDRAHDEPGDERRRDERMERTGVDWQGALATALAAVGTAVSLYTAYQGWRERHPRLGVRLAYGTAEVAGASERLHAGALGLVICVVNRGAVDVAIETVGLLGPDGRRLAFGAPRGTLAPGESLRARESAWFWVDPAEVARALATGGYGGLVELRAECVDGVGDTYRSAPVMLDLGTHDLEGLARREVGRDGAGRPNRPR